MIRAEPLSDHVLKITVTGKLEPLDFQQATPQIDRMIRAQGTLRLLVDATAFDGWASIDAARTHFAFVRDHHRKIERIALIAGHEWQHWLAEMASMFAHPEIRVFDAGEADQAQRWLEEDASNRSSTAA